MAVDYQQSNTFGFGGIEHRGDDLKRPPTAAADSLNLAPLSGGDEKTTRPGYQGLFSNAGNNGGFGTFLYQQPDGTTEVLVAGSKLFRKKTGTITIGYSGAGTSVLFSIAASALTNTIVFTINVDGADVFDMDLGRGYDEASIVTVADLITAIDAEADFSATLTAGLSTHPAAFLPAKWLEPITGGSYAMSFCYMAEVNHPTSAASPFQGSFDNRNATGFENISSLERNGSIYFANGYDWLKKYDGVDCYRAGLPQAGLTSVSDAAGAVGSGSYPDIYRHAVVAVQKDAQGYENVGMLSNEIETSIGVASNFTLTIQNVLAATGFNTDCAIVAGAQNGVATITVDNGSGGAHTMKVGQTAYFYDGVSAAYVEREITGVAAGTITIAGANVNVADNAVISNNLRLRVYRTGADAISLQEVVDLPNNSFAATQVYVDSVVDANLGADYDEAELFGREHAVAPKFKYLASFGGLAIGLGDPLNPTRVYFSDIDSPEYWPSVYWFTADSGDNDPVTGGAENGADFWVFKKKSIRKVVGDLLTGQFDVPEVTRRIGCVAHATIKRYDSLLCWLGEKGVYASENSSPPVDISKSIHRFFRMPGRDNSRRIVGKRALGVIDGPNQMFLLYVPTESASGSDVYANSDSRVLAYDFERNEWHIWSNMNMAGGAVIDDDDLYWVERRYSTFNSQMSYLGFRRHNTDTQYDYVDHVTAIPAYYKAGWVHAESPSVNKDFVSLKLYSNNSIIGPAFDITARTEVNFIADNTHSQTVLHFTGGTGQWGIGPWGNFAWGSPAENAIQHFRLVPKSVRSLRPVFEFESFFNRIVLTAWQLEMASSHEAKMKF